MAVITVENLHKTYPDGTQALKGISFAVEEGEFFGLLGPNGAGKTTTIKTLMTLLAPSQGQVLVDGFDVQEKPAEVRRVIGYAAQAVGVDDDLTGRENLLLQGQLYHLPKSDLRARVDELLALMDLQDDANRPAGAYSGGMRKRLDLATGLVHRPRILVLDEPTTGLDPQNRANLWRYLERVNKDEGLTVLLTTHYMEEADRLCGRLAIIDHGLLVAQGSPADLKADLGGHVLQLVLREGNADATANAKARLTELPGVTGVNEGDGGLQVSVRDGGEAIPAVLRALDAANVAVARLSMTSPTLDDVFLKHTGTRIRSEELDTKWRGRGSPFFSRKRRP